MRQQLLRREVQTSSPEDPGFLRDASLHAFDSTADIGIYKGSADKIDPRHENPSGVDTKHFKDNISSQRPTGQEKIQEKFYEAQLGRSLFLSGCVFPCLSSF